MNTAITHEELLAWNLDVASFWRAHFDANPAVLELPCGIDDAGNVQGLVRHIWGAELIWSQRIAGLAERNRSVWPAGPLDALFAMHIEAARNFRALLDSADTRWNESLVLNYAWLPPQLQRPTRRKIMAHALLHSQRHWAQLTTHVRAAGFPSGFLGDLIFSSALE